MNDEQKVDYQQYWGIPKDVSKWSTKAIAELVSLGYEMSDQGEPMYEAYALGMVAIISELRTMNKALTELLKLQIGVLEKLETEKERTAPAEEPKVI